MQQAQLIVTVRPEPNHWAVYQGLTMRLRTLVDAAWAAEPPNSRARKPRQVEGALQSLEAEIARHTERLTEDLLRPRIPAKPSTPLPAGDIPDLIGLA